MMCMLNAGERTLDEFIALGWGSDILPWRPALILVVFVSAEAGLEFVQLWDFAENAMVEFKAV